MQFEEHLWTTIEKHPKSGNLHLAVILNCVESAISYHGLPNLQGRSDEGVYGYVYPQNQPN